MLKQTVYIPITEFNENTVPIITAKIYGYNQPEEPVMFEKWEGYFLTQDQLTELLSNAFNAGADINYHLNHQDDQNGTWVPNSTQYIDKLLK